MAVAETEIPFNAVNSTPKREEEKEEEIDQGDRRYPEGTTAADLVRELEETAQRR